MNSTVKFWIGLVAGIVFAFAVFGNIFSKAGYSRWYGLLTLIPGLNLVLLIAFAYSNWPIENELLKSQFNASK